MLGIITALDTERDAVLSQMEAVKESQTAGMRFFEGTLYGRKAVVAESGVGKVMAAAGTAIMLTRWPVRELLNIGIAGGLVEGMQPLDLVLSQSLVQADFDSSAVDGPEGLGIAAPADPQMVERARKAAERLHIPTYTGLIASQDLFLARPDDIKRLLERFPETRAAEMEGAAVASVAQAFGVPCLVVRAISDVVQHPQSHLDFWKFRELAAAQAGRFLQAYLQEGD